MSSDPVTFYGFTAVPRNPDVLFKDVPTAHGDNPKQDTGELDLNDLPFIKGSALVNDVREFVKKELDERTFNHSNRVYIYGTTLVKTHFPNWSYDRKTFYIACLLHDIGTADRYLATTKMSFEFKGGIVARDLILSKGGVEDQADSVCDAIIRHQDIFVTGGNITMIGQILQLATILDNVGLRANLVHPNLIKNTCAKFPRNGWSNFFGSTIEKELSLKPWCHTTTFEVPNWKEGIPSQFATDVLGNTVMQPYD